MAATTASSSTTQNEAPTFGLWCGKKHYFVYKKDQDDNGFESLGTITATNRTHYSVVKLNQSLLIYGGLTDQSRTVHNDVQIVDTAARRALETKNNPASGRFLHTAVIRYTNNMTPVMVVFGGRGSTEKCFNDILELDIQTREWTQINASGDIPVAREGHSAILHREKMYIFGGRNCERTFFFDDLFEFDFATNTWRNIQIQGLSPNIPSVGRSCHSMVACDGTLLFLGGFDKSQYRTDLIACNAEDGLQARQISIGKINTDTFTDASNCVTSFLTQHQRYKQKQQAIADGTLVAAPVVDPRIKEEHMALKNKIVRELIDQEMAMFFTTPTEDTLRRTLILQYTHSVIKEFPLFQRQQKQESRTASFFSKMFRRSPSTQTLSGTKSQKELEMEADNIKNVADLFFLSPPLMTKIEKSFKKDLRKIFADFLKSIFTYSIKTEWERSTWDDMLESANDSESENAFDEDDAKQSGTEAADGNDDKNYIVIMNPDGTILRKPKNLITKILTLDQPIVAYNRIRTTEKIKDLPAGYQEIFTDLRKKFTRMLKVTEVSDEHIDKLRWIKRSLMVVKPLLEVMNPLAIVDKLLGVLLFSRVGKSGVRLTLELGKTETMIKNLKKHLHPDIVARIDSYTLNRSAEELAEIQIIMNRSKSLPPLSPKLQEIEREAEEQQMAEWGYADKKGKKGKKGKKDKKSSKDDSSSRSAQEPKSPATATSTTETASPASASAAAVDEDVLRKQLEELIFTDELKKELECEEEAAVEEETEAHATEATAGSSSAAPAISVTDTTGTAVEPKQSTTANAATNGGAASSRHNTKIADGDLSDLDPETVAAFREFITVTINQNSAALNAHVTDSTIVDYSEYYYLCIRYKEKKEFLHLIEDPIVERMLKQLLRTLMPPLIKLYGNADIGRLMDALITAIGKFIKLKDEEKAKGLRLSPTEDPNASSSSSKRGANVATTGRSKIPSSQPESNTASATNTHQNDEIADDVDDDADADFDIEEEELDVSSDVSTKSTSSTVSASSLVVPPLAVKTAASGSSSAPVSPHVSSAASSPSSPSVVASASAFPTAAEIAANDLEKERHIWNVKLEAVFRKLEEEIFLFARDVITKDSKGDRTIERLINWAFALTTVMGQQKVNMTAIVAEHGSDERVLTDVFRKKMQSILFETAKRAGAEMDTSAGPPPAASSSSPRKSPRK